MTTLKELEIGTVIVYNDASNVDLEYIVLDSLSESYTRVMNLESKNIEEMHNLTKIDGNRWSIDDAMCYNQYQSETHGY